MFLSLHCYLLSPHYVIVFCLLHFVDGESCDRALQSIAEGSFDEIN